MKRAYFLILPLILIMILAGCAKKISQVNNVAPANQPETNQAVVKAPSTNTFQKFRPDSNPVVNQPATAPSDSARNFVVTQELELKLYLVDKYKPGTCYGLPGPVSDLAISGLITRSGDLAQFVKSRYQLTSDLDVYNKIKQINGIALTKIAGGKYQFNFTNGQCCTLTAYEGEISIIGQTISDTIIRQETKQNPC